jgi:hypothetical protein
VITSAVTFAAVLPGLLVAHQVGDHWLQTDRQARRKADPGWPGRWACAAHVASYTAVTAGVVALLWLALDLSITPIGFVGGQVVSAVTHYWADRRTTVTRLATAVGKSPFLALGQPRPGRDDNPTLGTGAYALDQSWHQAWLLVAALLTALVGGGWVDLLELVGVAGAVATWVAYRVRRRRALTANPTSESSGEGRAGALTDPAGSE